MSTLLQRVARGLFFQTLRNLQDGYLEIVCPDETYSFGDPSAELRAMAVIHDERFFLRAITATDIGTGESFMDGDWTSPDLVALVRSIPRILFSPRYAPFSPGFVIACAPTLSAAAVATSAITMTSATTSTGCFSTNK
jgi:hypothetical protein